MNKTSIIIPAAGMGVRMKIGNPKCITKLSKNNYAVNRLISQLIKKLPEADVYLCVGYKSELVRSRVRHDVKFIECNNYEATTACESIRLALDSIGDGNALICMGDLVFSDGAFERLCVRDRNTIWGETSLIREDEVGLTPTDDGLVGHLSHGLPIRWAQIVYLRKECVEQLKLILRDSRSCRWYFYEALNKLIELFPFYFEQLSGWMVEIDSVRDVSLARYAIERDRDEVSCGV